MVAYLTTEVEEPVVLQLLADNHGLDIGKAVGRHKVDFNHPAENGRQTVSVTLTYALTKSEIDQLLR